MNKKVIFEILFLVVIMGVSAQKKYVSRNRI